MNQAESFIMDATERPGPAIEPREIKQEGDAGVRITWGDGLISSFTAAGLRTSLPLRPVRERMDWAKSFEARVDRGGVDDQ